MLAAWAKGMEGILFLLWIRTTFKLTFDKSMNKRHWSELFVFVFMAKYFHNRTNIIAKHDTTFQGGEILEFFMVHMVKTHLNVPTQKILAL